jgi:hypothetical protein
MTKRFTLALVSALVAVGLLLAPFVFAADRTRDAATGDGVIESDAAIDRQIEGECPWGRAPVGRPTRVGNAGINKALEVSPGTKCVITAELECEIHAVNEDVVLVTVTAIREAEQGVPMLTKLPHTNRLFKNVGVGRTETRVVLSISKDRIKVITPIRDGAP